MMLFLLMEHDLGAWGVVIVVYIHVGDFDDVFLALLMRACLLVFLSLFQTATGTF